MQANVRVLHVIGDLAVAGAEMMLLKLASRSHGARFNHAVVTLDRDGALVPQFRNAGIDVHSLGWWRSRVRLASIAALRHHIRGFAPTVIQGWMYHGNLVAYGGRWLSSSHATLVWNIRQTLYDLDNEKRTTSAVIRVGAMLSRRPAAIIYNSATSARQHESFGYEASRHQLIPNGFDCDALAPDTEIRQRVRTTLGLREIDVVIGLVARFRPMKDHRNFVAAAARVAANHENVRFLVVGNGVTSTEAGIVAAIEQAGLRDKAIVLEERRDVRDLFNAMDVSCLSSAWGEGFPNVLGEAMACGVPCVATDIGDSSAIIGDTGRVVAPRDPAALAAAIGELVVAGREHRRALGAAARRRIEERYSIGSIVSQYEALYETLPQHPVAARKATAGMPAADH